MAISVGIPATEAADSFCAARENNNANKLMECVTLDGVRVYLAEFQAIADANGGNRNPSTDESEPDGFDESAEYVASLMTAAGYDVTVQPFTFDAFRRFETSVLQQTAPASATYSEKTHFHVAEFSAPGDITASVTAVDLQLFLGNTSTSGCDASDFAGFPAGNIALMQRGTCEFEVKAENAFNAGAVGAIIFNQGNTVEREGLFGGSLTTDYTGGIPVLLISNTLGVQLYNTSGLALHMNANVFRGDLTTTNVIAETFEGWDDQVVVVGAPLDSAFYYPNSPGINSNGSGAAAILEIALQMKNVTPVNKVRFIWWGAEQDSDGEHGSKYYFNNLTNDELANIMLYLNIETIGSPNYVQYVHDGNNAIETQFEHYFSSLDIPYKSGVLFSFAVLNSAGIPVGGLSTGTGIIKTAEDAAIYGGTAGIQLDPCYTLACDTYDNINNQVLNQNADAAAFAVIQNAMGSKLGKIKVKNATLISSGLAVK